MILTTFSTCVLLILAALTRTVLTNEYDSWAMPAARLLVKLAGRLHPQRRDEWNADLFYLQDCEGKASVLVALSHCLCAPGMSVMLLFRSSGPGLDGAAPGFRYLKRGMDIAFSSCGLVVMAPIFAIAALAIRLTSKSPIIYSQYRYGRDGVLFQMYRFGTMDSRGRTRVGRAIHLLGLADLPQFINILRGEMSVVGPRAMTPEFADILNLEPTEHDRFKASPGLTGQSQTQFGPLDTIDDMIAYDLNYVNQWSLAKDIRIVATTFAAIRRRNSTSVDDSKLCRRFRP